MGNGGFGEILEKRHAFIFAYNTPAGAVVPSETPASQVGHLLVTRRTPSARRKKPAHNNVTWSWRNPNYVPLPLGVIEDGKLKQYAWNGKLLQALDPGVLAKGDNTLDRLLSRLRHVRHACVEAFFPGPGTVTEDYWEYIWWRAGHRLSSAMLNNFATQALLAAVGVGAQRQLPAAATINWLLKDGLGRLGRLSIAASFGQSFDSDLKRFRWLTSLVFSASIALEFLTPLLPKQFLLLACLSNIGKSVGVTTYVATHPAFMRSFAIGENLADINAKGQAQQMVMDTLGLAFCVGLTYCVRRHARMRLLLPLLTFPILVSADLLCIYHELKATHLNTLNRERAEIVAERWLLDGKIFSAKEVSKQEKLLFESQVGGGSLPLHFATLDRIVNSPSELTRLLRRHRDQNFVLNYLHQPYRQPYVGAGIAHGHLAACLEHGASPESILTAILQAAVFRRVVLQTDGYAACSSQVAREGPDAGYSIDSYFADSQQVSSVRPKSGGSKTGVQGIRWHSSKVDPKTVDEAMEHAAEVAKHAGPQFFDAIRRADWQTNTIKLSTRDKNGFTMIAD